MSEDGVVNEAAVDETVEPEPEHVSGGYKVVMFDVAAPALRLADWDEEADPKFFIQGREPDEEGKKRIQDVGMKIDASAFMGGGNRQERRAMKYGKQKATKGGGVEINASAAFVQKCLECVADFLLPTVVMGADMKPHDAEQRYDPANGGDNEGNKRIYEILLRRQNEDLRQVVDDYLDFAAGLDTPGRADFEALGNAR